MNIFIERSKKNVKIKFKGKVTTLLKKLGLNPETVLVTRNKILLTEEDVVNNSDELKILSVISGG